jgi:hypothetical protein
MNLQSDIRRKSFTTMDLPVDRVIKGCPRSTSMPSHRLAMQVRMLKHSCSPLDLSLRELLSKAMERPFLPQSPVTRKVLPANAQSKLKNHNHLRQTPSLARSTQNSREKFSLLPKNPSPRELLSKRS